MKIVIGGYHATLMYEEIAASDEAALIDFIIRGEGEEAFRRLINALGGKDRLEEIPSLSFKKATGLFTTPGENFSICPGSSCPFGTSGG